MTLWASLSAADVGTGDFSAGLRQLGTSAGAFRWSLALQTLVTDSGEGGILGGVPHALSIIDVATRSEGYRLLFFYVPIS